jgi:hypothetical protein
MAVQKYSVIREPVLDVSIPNSALDNLEEIPALTMVFYIGII